MWEALARVLRFGPALSTDEFFGMHWQRFLQEHPQADVEYRPMGHLVSPNAPAWGFDDVRRYMRKNREVALQTIESVFDDTRLQVYANPGNIPSFVDLLPADTAEKDPEFYQKFRDWMAEPERIVISEFQRRIAVRERVFQRLRRARGDIDLSDLAAEHYDALSGALSYGRTINHPDYTLNDENDELFNLSQRGDVFYSRKKEPFKHAVALYSGTSFQERLWFRRLNSRQLADDHKRIFVDASSFSLDILKLFDPEREGNVYVSQKLGPDSTLLGQLSSVPALVVKTNGLAVDEPKGTFGQMQRDIRQLGEGSLYWVTVPTVHSPTDERIYASANDHFIHDFLREYMLVPEHVESAFRPIAPKVDCYGGFYFNIGFEAVEDVTLYDQYGRREVSIPKGRKIFLHRSHRYDTQHLEALERNLGLGSVKLSKKNSPSVALFKHI